MVHALGDPGDSITHWLVEGVPAGIAKQPVLDKVFKRWDGACDLPDFELSTDCDSFVNYKGFDQDEEAQQAVQGYVDAGYLKAYDSADQARMELGGTPVLSRFGVLRRVKDGVTKRRVILDAKQSRITAHTRPTYRVELPRATDVVNLVLSTAQWVQPENLELL
eukprot:1791621-Amphidinium_carterae.1